MPLLTARSQQRPPLVHTPAISGPALVAVPPDGSLHAVRPRHLFVDNVRFWCIFSIVAVHSVGIFSVFGQEQPGLVETILTPLKFGTIGFFLISGFLIGRGTETSRPIPYLGRRLKRVFVPWLCWFSLFVSTLLAADLRHHRIDLTRVASLLHFISLDARSSLLYSAFWFVPNLLLSLCLLMVFKRYLQYRRFGAVLLAINLFYVANIYRHWVPTSHTEAMFGFVFYLWLGTYVFRHHIRFEQWMRRTSMAALLGATTFFALLSYAESRLLYSLNSHDGLNTLRLSNQLFSIAAVLVLYKLQRTTWPSFVDVRNNTFGIYLIHLPFQSVVYTTATSRFLRPIALHLLHTKFGSLVLWMIITAIIYLGALLLTKAIASLRRLQWLVGVETEKAPAL